MITKIKVDKVNAAEGLAIAFTRLDGLLGSALDLTQNLYESAQSGILPGLQIQPEEVSRLLDRPPCKSLLWSSLVNSNEASIKHSPRLSLLAKHFCLSTFDIDVLIIAMAPEFDLRYERIYAFLQDDITRKRPSIDLALSLLCQTTEEKLVNRARFTPESPLLRTGLITLGSEAHQATYSFLSSTLFINSRFVQWLCGETEMDERLISFCSHSEPTMALDDLYLNDPIKTALKRWITGADKEDAACNIYLYGKIGSGRKQVAEAIAMQKGMRLITFKVEKALKMHLDFNQVCRQLVLEAWFQSALIYIENADVLDFESHRHEFQCISELIERNPGLIVLSGKDEGWIFRNCLYSVMTLALTMPTVEIRQALWQKHLADTPLTILDFNHLAQRFRFTPGQISASCEMAQTQAKWLKLMTPDYKLKLSDLMLAARNQTGHALSTLARKISPSYQWNDLILPDDQRSQLEEICLQFNHQYTVYNVWGLGRKLSLGRGLNILFSGPPGTGKTMAAEVIANQIGLDLYKIDLSQIVSKYIGETEKNLDKIFSAAEDANAILFFDEADALFGKRSEVKDAHDRYANIEVGYLLQKMEEYEGIAILATNLKNHLDDAFVRRLQFIIEFPMPDENYRKRIWETLFPADVPVGDDVDFQILAREIRVAGGNIKNIGLASAFYAANDGGVIRMPHLLHAARREHQKLGRSWNGFKGAAS